MRALKGTLLDFGKVRTLTYLGELGGRLPSLARFGRRAMSDWSPLLGAKRKSQFEAVRSAHVKAKSCQTGATEAFQIMLPISILLDGHFACDPSERNIGLHAAKFS